MTQIRDALQMIGMLERGETAQALSDAFAEALSKLNDMSIQRPKAKLKGKLNLKIEMEVEDGSVAITADIETKLPKAPRSRSFYFLTADGKLSTEHPRQSDMFGPRDAGTTRGTA